MSYQALCKHVMLILTVQGVGNRHTIVVIGFCRWDVTVLYASTHLGRYVHLSALGEYIRGICHAVLQSPRCVSGMIV
jgi:hypothetical protein